jgi:hypothetical protein
MSLKTWNSPFKKFYIAIITIILLVIDYDNIIKITFLLFLNFYQYN